jgi:catechol 2,3-dioxygenase-like lactoylglutathione lyase family enzyme
LDQVQPVDAPKPKAAIKFVYQHCNDLPAMRRFYTELVGMNETSFKDEGDWHWLVYKCDGFEFMIFPASEPLPVTDAWSAQPGYDGGTLDGMSWSVEVPEPDFAATVDRLRAAGVPRLWEWPTWQQDSYWSFPVRDPQGNTVEVCCTVAQRPASTTWEPAQ